MSDIKTKFINDPEQITPELLEGYTLAYADQVKLAGENIRRLRPRTGVKRFCRRRYAGLLGSWRYLRSSRCTTSVSGLAVNET